MNGPTREQYECPQCGTIGNHAVTGSSGSGPSTYTVSYRCLQPYGTDRKGKPIRCGMSWSVRCEMIKAVDQ